MKKEEIKRDIIRENLISFIHYLSENMYIVWSTIIGLSLLIVLVTYVSNNKESNYSHDNEILGLAFIDEIYNSESNDSLKMEEFNQFLNNTSKTKEGYNSAFIYVLNKLYVNNDMDMIKDMLENNSFDSDDNMFNAYYYKMKSEVLYSGDLKNSTKFLMKAINAVESFDLKVSYCEELVDMYISNNMLDKASIYFENFKEDMMVNDIPLAIENNLDFIDYKIQQLRK